MKKNYFNQQIKKQNSNLLSYKSNKCILYSLSNGWKLFQIIFKIYKLFTKRKLIQYEKWKKKKKEKKNRYQFFLNPEEEFNYPFGIPFNTFNCYYY